MQLTTGQAAKYAGVATQTLSRWIDKGILPGWRVPFSRHRRVKACDLVSVLEQHGMPVADELRAMAQQDRAGSLADG